MTLAQYNLDAGPEGGSVNNTLSGSVASSVGGGSTTTFTAATAAHGAFGMRVNCAAGSQAFRRWMFAGSTPTSEFGNVDWAASFVLTMPSSAVGNTVIILNATTSTDANRLQINLEASGNLIVTDSGLAHQETFATGLSWGSKYRISIVAAGGSTTASTVTIKVYSGTSAWTTQVGSTFTASDFNLGTDEISRFNFGVNANSAAAAILGIDDIQLDDGRTTEIPDFAVPNVPPVVTAGPAQTVAAGATVNLAFTATDGDGTIASRATMFDYPASGGPTISGGTGNSPSFTAGSAGSRYVVRHTATDNLGGTHSATTEIFVPVAGGDVMRPELADGTGVGTWTIGGGSSTHGHALADDTGDTTYVESPDVSSTEQTLRVRLRPSEVKASGQVKNRLYTSEGTADATVRLYEGSTLRQSWTHALTSTATEYTDTLSGATIAAISDWNNLFIEVGVTS